MVFYEQLRIKSNNANDILSHEKLIKILITKAWTCQNPHLYRSQVCNLHSSNYILIYISISSLHTLTKVLIIKSFIWNLRYYTFLKSFIIIDTVTVSLALLIEFIIKYHPYYLFIWEIY